MKFSFYKSLIFLMLFSSLGFAKELTLGERAPSFQVETAQGKMSFPEDFLGEWTLFMSVPNIQTTVCTLELMECLKMSQEWEEMEAHCLLLTCHDQPSQNEWLKNTVEKLRQEGMDPKEDCLTLIPDPEKKIAHLYGMIHPCVTSEKPIRVTIVVDPNGKIRFLSSYPIKNGRNFEEITRLVAAMQKTDESSSFVTSPRWKKGDAPNFCVPCGQAKK